MIYLTDTNVLLRFARHTDASYPIIQMAVRKLQANGHQLQTTSQNVAEFWNVSTRPTSRNGFGLTPYETNGLLQDLEETFPLLLDFPDAYSIWRQLVVKYDVSGVQVHDARLVATMLVYDVKHILTFNTQDFTRYIPEGIVPVDASEEIN